MLDLGLLTVNRVVVHEIPQRRASEAGGGPILSSAESPLTDDLRVFLRDRIIATAGSSAAYDIVLDTSGSSPVPALLLEFLGGQTSDLLELSCRMAHHLYSSQTGVSPRGLLAVMDCTVADAPALAVLKLEVERGVRVHRSDDRYDLEYIRNLMLSERTRLFKIAAFVGDGDPNNVSAAVCDFQRGYSPRTEVADFFLVGFLGCALREQPDVLTKRFFHATEEFINENVTEPVRRASYLNHLLSEMMSERGAIDATVFASDYLQLDDRQAYLDYLEGHEVPTARFDKDVSLVEPRIRRMSLDFESGISIVGPRSAVEERVSLDTTPEGSVKAEIVDRLKRVRGS